MIFLNLKTKLKIFSLLLFICSFSVPGHARGGFVGNGASLTELQFEFAYRALSRWVLTCSENSLCEMSDREEEILSRMKMVTGKNLLKIKKFVFVRAKDDPQRFQTHPGEPHRIAVTGLTPEVPIYVNLDLVESSDGRPLLEVPEILALLAHEVGHQAGYEDHQELNVLGSKLKALMKVNLSVYEFYLDEELGSQSLKVEVYNHEFPSKTAFIRVIEPNGESRELTGKISRQMTLCQSKGLDLIGFDLFNGHFQKEQIRGGEQLDFVIWARLLCLNPLTGETSIENQVIRQDLGFEGNLFFLQN